VTFVYGRPSQVPVVRGHQHDYLTLIAVETIEDLVAVFRQELPRGYDAVVHPMAVLDFQPDVVREEKTGSGVQEWVIRLVPTPKVIGLVKALAPETFLIGFKLEVGKPPEELQSIAYDFLTKNHADLVVANDLRDIEAGQHRGYFIAPDGSVVRTVNGKEAIARAVVEHLDAHLR
jgi:phosphopantothenoylcysteine synthetase/decarboxylase